MLPTRILPNVQKTTVTKLQKAGVSNDKIRAITGHKREESIKYYTDTDLEEQRNIGRKISRVASLEKQSELPQASFSTSSKEEGINMRDCIKSLCPQFNFYNCTVNFGNQQTCRAP